MKAKQILFVMELMSAVEVAVSAAKSGEHWRLAC